MFVGTKYDPQALQGSFDTIVIGSGMGGLTLAALQALSGLRVLVLERHYTAGGFTHSFSRKGYEWDVGVHYVGEVLHSHSPLRRLFDAISQGRLEWADMGSVVDRIDVGDGFIDFAAGKRAFKEGVLAHFPQASKDIDRYLAAIAAGERDMARVAAPRMLPGVLDRFAAPLSSLVGLGHFGKTTQEVMAGVTRDARLAGVLTGQWGDYGLPPSQSSFGIHALVARHYLRGAAYPVGGASQIARSIVPTIEASGGQVLVKAEVVKVLIKGNKAIGVQMADGTQVLASTVVSAAGIDTTARQLLPRRVAERLFPVKKRIAPSVGHVGLNLGFKASTEELGLERANMWLHASPDHDANMARFMDNDAAAFPFVYASFPSAKDPTWAARHPQRSTVDLIAAAPYARFQQWAEEPWRKRGAEYQDYKAHLSEKMLEVLFRKMPQLRGKIDYQELSTPLSTQTFCNYGSGQLYGLDHTPERFAQSWMRPKTGLDGFYLTGQDVMTCGVGGALFGGVATFAAMRGLASLPTFKRVLT